MPPLLSGKIEAGFWMILLRGLSLLLSCPYYEPLLWFMTYLFLCIFSTELLWVWWRNIIGTYTNQMGTNVYKIIGKVHAILGILISFTYRKICTKGKHYYQDWTGLDSGLDWKFISVHTVLSLTNRGTLTSF